MVDALVKDYQIGVVLVHEWWIVGLAECRGSVAWIDAGVDSDQKFVV